ncbi:hypothetical protein F5Y10DRAFT_272221 [Nemania abortiva]|nr:hypothetical protein F5Y10DRAFT_272221 [Nemania abortiva]
MAALSTMFSGLSLTAREPTRPFRLLDLPPELRRLIYEAILAPEPFIQLDLCDSWGHFLNFLVANRQIYREAEPILYRRNIFCTPLNRPAALDTYLQMLGPIASKIIHLRIPMPVMTSINFPPQRLNRRGVENLRSIQRMCTSIERLDMDITPRDRPFFDPERTSPVLIEPILSDYLSRLDEELKRIRSLKRVTIVYTEPFDLSPTVKDAMREFGWFIKRLKPTPTPF